MFDTFNYHFNSPMYLRYGGLIKQLP